MGQYKDEDIPNHGKPWSSEDVKKLEQWWSNGHTIHFIAVALRRKRSAIYGKLHNTGLITLEGFNKSRNSPKFWEKLDSDQEAFKSNEDFEKKPSEGERSEGVNFRDFYGEEVLEEFLNILRPCNISGGGYIAGVGKLYLSNLSSTYDEYCRGTLYEGTVKVFEKLPDSYGRHSTLPRVFEFTLRESGEHGLEIYFFQEVYEDIKLSSKKTSEPVSKQLIEDDLPHIIPEAVYALSGLQKVEVDTTLNTCNNTISNNTGDKDMANLGSSNTRRVVTVNLWDDDGGLPVELALVAQYTNVVTEDDDQTTIQQVIMDKDVAKAIGEHNEGRAATVDEAILKQTGNEVQLRPIKLKDLRWEVRQA